jgi:hypothetical protein
MNIVIFYDIYYSFSKLIFYENIIDKTLLYVKKSKHRFKGDKDNSHQNLIEVAVLAK